MKYKNIINASKEELEQIPVTEFPKEIMDYYMKNYDEKVVPLSVKTIKGIAKILVEEKLEVDLGKYGVHYISTPPMSSGTIC